jgi:hypothetical protein
LGEKCAWTFISDPPYRGGAAAAPDLLAVVLLLPGGRGGAGGTVASHRLARFFCWTQRGRGRMSRVYGISIVTRVQLRRTPRDRRRRGA